MDPKAKSHPFYSDWIKWKYYGLHPTNDWKTASSILKCNTYGKYIDTVQRCPFITQQYDLQWDINTNTMQYHYKDPLDMKHY
jgi:hypothetical protein